MFRSTVSAGVLALAVVCTAVGCTNANDRMDDKSAAVMSNNEQKTGAFQGVKANTGYAIPYHENGKSLLKVSDDFVIPDTPAPSWQLVDSSGNVYLIKQFKIKSGANRVIEIPSYVKDVSKVQVWCSYAEVLLGEASFASPVK